MSAVLRIVQGYLQQTLLSTTIGCMSDHIDHVIERHCDVAIIGGSAAGLAAALQLGRQRRSVIVIDSGEPRNAPAAHVHGFLGCDGTPPSDLLAAGREEVRSYGGEIIGDRALRVTRDEGGQLRVELQSGHSVVARRVVAATGLVDTLPPIDDLAAHWGRDVIHCPFCHGYEVRDQRIVQVVTHPTALHTTQLFRQLTRRLTVVVDDGVAVDADQVDVLRAAGVGFVIGTVQRLIEGDRREVTAVELVDGTRIDTDVVAIAPDFRVRADPFLSLGLRATPHPSGRGDHLDTDAMGQTSVAGLFAAGNVTDPSHQVLQAAADGARVGAVISFSLAEEDTRGAGRPPMNEVEWEQRYDGEQVWSGSPNGALVREVSGLTPGRALDVGAGEGGDALWLTDQGWTVTATDISTHALERLATKAARRGLTVGRLRTDANAPDAFEPGAFDLVTAHYASIPRTADDRAIRSLMRAVAAGGTLLVVSHDPSTMRGPDGRAAHPWDPDAYVQADDVAAMVTDAPGWHVTVHGRLPRPSGAIGGSHHVDDIVLRARRVA